jgi:hypothetical protein
MDQTMRLVTVATFDSSHQAHVVRHRLMDAGIDAIIMDDETISMHGHLSVALGGIKVMVREERAEEAYQLLHDPKTYGTENGPEPIDEEELTRQALAESREDEEPEEEAEDEEQSPVPDSDENHEEPTEQPPDTAHFLRGGLFILLYVIAFVMIYQVLNAMFTD